VRPDGATKQKWRTLDGKVESGLMSDSELQGGSPRLCRLRTDRLASVNKIEFVLTHTGYMEPCKLSTYGGR
jgi:hypothetical protein